ncbi:IucA/IucC family protein [Paenibacillus kobensis]|uniref:IucA/IucC family protein n=1 Tax=Paenibacillus kobensis TaxID=59841 RepID=UPI000FD96DDB|nr:IucA/IucC family protein [Paenibacillus kobensis]
MLLETGNIQQIHNLEQANRHACKLLMNSYIREFGGDCAGSLSLQADDKTYSVSFPVSGVIVSGRLAFYSAIGEHEYESFQVGGDCGCGGKLDYADLARWIVKELRQAYPDISDERADDFCRRIENSCRNVALYIGESDRGAVMAGYLSSEQSLLYGHPMHPFPKNTIGFSDQEVRMYGPELRASFRLCYWAVRKDVFVQERAVRSSRLKLHESVLAHAERMLGQERNKYELLPMHPWQYGHVQMSAAVQAYMEERKLVPLGACGPLAYPTSSVRTVYIPVMQCNLKLPLDIQITNLKRNNSEEQMRRTLDAANYLLQHGAFAGEINARIAYEEGICSCRFGSDEWTKLFTVAYRPVEFDAQSTYVLSSLVEAPAAGERSRLFALTGNCEMDLWFQRYLDISLLPVVRIAEEKGIHFEAHLQNCLLTLQDGMPHVFIIRDLEGVSVNRDKAEPDAAGSLFYRKEEAWARTDYYFMVNHLGSLIHALARDNGKAEEHYWSIVRGTLERELHSSGGQGNEYVEHLLTADAFYAKRNLVSCLAGNSETPSYAAVGNVMKTMGSERIG